MATPASDDPTRPPGDADPGETQEWRDALDGLVRQGGEARALYVLRQLTEHAQAIGLVALEAPHSAYQNTVSLAQQGPYPGDLALEHRISAIIRWNALAMVVRANQVASELGGHIASYASAAEIFEAGFNHFFRAANERHGGDLVYFQPHSAPGVYARAFLEGELSESQLGRYRQEVGGGGLCSYPHPWLMPGFWQFPTGSMGLGPISAIYQARFMRYLEHRGFLPSSDRRVWGVFGDGEMDEPESIGALTLAAREGLDNLTFVINCNLQRLDGPVRGNGQIIQELESLFTGAGWLVIKVLWGSDWDALFARDTNHALLRQFAATVDGQYQTLGANDGNYNRDHFFGLDPELQALVAHMTPAEIDGLTRGGHDFRKLYAAFKLAREHKGQPTVILAKTKKGYGMGTAGESRMTAHQQKKLDLDAIREFRDRFALPLSDEDMTQLRFYKPPEDSREMIYPARASRCAGRLSATAPARSARGADSSACAIRSLRAGGGRQGNVDDHGCRPASRQSVEGQDARSLRRAHRGRRGPHVRDGEPVSPGRHLFAARPTLRARGCAFDARLSRGARRAAPRGGHHRGRRAVLVDRRCDFVQRAWPRDAAVLHLLLDVRLPAGGRSHLGGRRPTCARLPPRCDGGSNDPRRRGPAAPGRQQPRRRRDDSQLPRLRPHVRLRARGHPRPRHAPDDGAAGR
jgi:transketolase N-terminal domain/subunit